MILGSQYIQDIEDKYGERFTKELVKDLKKQLGEDFFGFHFDINTLEDVRKDLNKIDMNNLDSKCFENTFIQYDKNLYNLMIKYDFNIFVNYKNVNFENPKNLFIIVNNENKLMICEKFSLTYEYALKNYQKLIFEKNDFYKMIHGKKHLLDLNEKEDLDLDNDFTR